MSREEEFDKLFLSLFREEPQTNITYPIKENKFDTYFEMTEKISSENKYIQDLTFEGEKIGRKYLGNNKEIKYIEVFKNKKFNILGISPKITFLHLYESKEEKQYNENKFIGFKYYDKGPDVVDSKYFTLVNRYDSKYFILEKNASLRDINNELFFDKELNCFSIIQNIITQKYINENNSIYGETFPEIIGYCYALKSLNKFNNFVFIEPLIPEPFKPETIKEDVPSNLDDNITYVEPFIYNDHISLILFTEKKGTRLNIILDMSRHHTNTTLLNDLIFPKAFINHAFIYPKKSIQNYSSCCLWFYGEIESILKGDKYFSFPIIYDSIRLDRKEFIIDLINLIGNNYYKINNLFKKEKERSSDVKNIDLDRLFLNWKINYSLDKKIVVTKFLDLSSFVYNSKFFYFKQEVDFINKTQKKLETFVTYKNLLEINLKFYELQEPKKEIETIKEAISEEIKYINQIMNFIVSNYYLEFIRKNISSYRMFLSSDVAKGKALDFPISKEMKEILAILNFDSIISSNCSEFELRKQFLELQFNIYSVEDIIKQLNPKNDIYLKLMSK